MLPEAHAPPECREVFGWREYLKQWIATPVWLPIYVLSTTPTRMVKANCINISGCIPLRVVKHTETKKTS